MNINYKKDPKIFSNTAFISYSYFELLEDLLNYSIPITPETIIGLSILSEAVVLHEELVVSNNEFQCSESEKELIKMFIQSGVLKYDVDYDIFTPKEYSAAEMMDNELDLYKDTEGIESQEIIYGQVYISRESNDIPIEENLSIFEIGFYDEDHFRKVAEYQLQKEKIAKLHGMPLIRGIYYANWGEQEFDFSYMKEVIDTSLSQDLLKGIDKKRFRYITKLQQYLGNTYVGLPSIISIILSRAKNIIDIPNQIILLREEVSKFRRECTNFETDLRKEDNFLNQCKIIDEIENAYNSLNIDGNFKKKRRIIKEGAEIFNFNPILLATNIGKKVLNEMDDKYIQLKVPGYYDLYKKSFDVKDNLCNLTRLFGDSIDSYFIQKLNYLSKL